MKSKTVELDVRYKDGFLTIGTPGNSLRISETIGATFRINSSSCRRVRITRAGSILDARRLFSRAIVIQRTRAGHYILISSNVFYVCDEGLYRALRIRMKIGETRFYSVDAVFE